MIPQEMLSANLAFVVGESAVVVHPEKRHYGDRVSISEGLRAPCLPINEDNDGSNRRSPLQDFLSCLRDALTRGEYVVNDNNAR